MKLLYNTQTQKTQPYPRADDEPVVGLDPIYTVLEVTQEPEPTFNAATHHLSGTETIDLVAGTLTRGWEIIANPPMPLGHCHAYQLRAWMLRGGLDPESVPAIIASVVPVSVPGGIGRAEALMRWEYATSIPRPFPLVDVIGAIMGLSPAQIDDAWPTIQSI